MSNAKSNPRDGGNKTVGRNLPSWMSVRDDDNFCGKKPADIGVDEEIEEGEKLGKAKEQHKACTQNSNSKKHENSQKSVASNAIDFSKLLEGIVFVLSGFVNPERGILRSWALEMGAEYQPDWTSECTLLVCAFPNTPKFRQVEADCGTIVSKEWISECYNKKKLVDIESYLMHAGKPWRKSNISHQACHVADHVTSSPGKHKKEVKESHARSTASASVKSEASIFAEEHFPPSTVKMWATNDLNETISWLENQEEKPEPSEIKKIAAEGILTCLQDAINTLQQKQDIRQITEQWRFVPRVVNELAKLEATRNSTALVSKENLYRQAVACRHVYEVELNGLDDNSSVKEKKSITDATVYDSDETIEMTEEEIELAYKNVASKIYKR